MARTYAPLEAIVEELFTELDGSDATKREVKEFVDIIVEREALEPAKVRVGNVDHYDKETIKFLFNTFVAYRYGATPDLIATMLNDPMTVIGIIVDIDRAYRLFGEPEEEKSEEKNAVRNG